ncbi:glycoside hydrolase [Cladorrhinum samala]|uniref:Beta-mannosidase B n=1 Tax=Cladorrhinum samala TaxID=585594 RepID=A0AAV9H6Z4_9PEZI|nr:glycoside hydrolase [Cladorrhinum samala]
MPASTHHNLFQGWKFKRLQDEKWHEVKQMPCDVHSGLIETGDILHPFADLNELDAAWIGEETWQYRVAFPAPEESTAKSTRTDIIFEGLDTFATVNLNGSQILSSDNMFLEHRVDISDILTKDGTDNILDIVFEPARQKGLEIVQAHPEHEFIVHQTEASRGPVRKAQYHWGWDWGPILMTVGPWKPVRLETYVSRIDQVRVDYTIETDNETPFVELTVSARIVGPAENVQLMLLYDGKTIAEVKESNNNTRSDPEQTPWNYTSAQVKLENPQLWWPRGYGGPNLYELILCIIAEDGTTLADDRQTIGFRKVELVQEQDNFGESFYFRVNNTDVFIGGSCWIPADSFLSKIPAQRYRDWMTLLADGNQNMIRVWGGGIYEHPAFYEACDELGILVWQDFMFACASYPTYPEFLSSIEKESTQALRRLRHHPSIILWCGNNEDYQIQERYNLEYDTSDADPESWLKSSFPARYIYEHLLPQLVSQETKPTSVIYRPSSPFGNGASTTLKVDSTVGDIHQWNMWHGEAKPFQLLPEMGGRFVSEFGMESYPHLETVHKFVSDEKERYPGSRTIDFHNKAIGYERRLLTYLSENYRLRPDLPAFVHLTQVLQADAMAQAYRSWRRQWGTEKQRRCGGALVWQLNDCWPTISWAVADYFLVRKPAWYAIRRAMAPVAVGVNRKFWDCTTRPGDGKLWKRDTGHTDPRKPLGEVEFDVWVAAARPELKHKKKKKENTTASEAYRLRVRFVGVNSGEDIKQQIEKDLDLAELNGTTEALVREKFEWDQGGPEREPFIIHASLSVGGVEVSSDVSWPDPIKYLDFSDRGVEVKYVERAEEDDTVEVSAKKPVKGFVFSERQGVSVSDNGFDLVPREKPVTVKIKGAKAQELSWTFVGQ